ncbi:MAG: hypothetical protein PHU86_01410 [Patescibacteria group bacterium]|nr:hypothetical protein [Patescibacteria group bacterium]
MKTLPNPYEKYLLFLKLIKEDSVIYSDESIMIWYERYKKEYQLSSSIVRSFIRQLNDENILDIKSELLYSESTPGFDAKQDIDFTVSAILQLNQDKLDNKIIEISDLYYQNELNKNGFSFPNIIQSKEIEDGNAIYRVKYQKQGCRIYINNFLLAKPNFNSENELVFNYLYNNPNRPVSIKEIEEKCLNSKVHKPLKSIVQNLGFGGELKKVFINVSNQGILFRNPIFRKDLDELNIKELKFGNK